MNSISGLIEKHRNMSWGIVGGLIVSLVNLPYRTLLTNLPLDPSLISIFSEGLSEAIPFLISVIIVAPFVEEVIFRVLLFRLLRDKFNLYIGYLGSTTLFTLGHAFPYKGGLVKNAIGSLIITYVYQKTDSIKAIFICHSLWNLTWFAAIYAFKLN